MFWKYTVKDVQLLLNATLLLFSVFAIFLGQSWKHVLEVEDRITANTVGVYAGVEENEINTLALQLDKKERELNAREITIVAKQNDYNKYTLILISIIALSLFGLILLNFYLDFKKRMSFV